jgi:crossover junction endodeoxyribonuclease RusA
VLEMSLPWPPSVNHYWRHPTRGALAGRHLISEEGRRYRNVVLTLAGVNQHDRQLAGSLGIEIKVHPPDRRKRDLDNILKALLDSITHAGVIVDDSCLDAIAIVRMPPVKAGRVDLTIFQLENL